MNKTCTKCEMPKPADREHFYKHATSPDGLTWACKECLRAQAKAAHAGRSPDVLAQQRLRWKAENPDKVKASQKRYVQTHRDQVRAYRRNWEYRKLGPIPPEPSDGCCQVCGQRPADEGKSLAVDHCHSSDKFRGWLCSKCNLGLGHFLDSPDLLRAAAVYIEKSYVPTL